MRLTMTYQHRLIFYVVLLVALLAGMMTLSFQAAREIIMANADNHLLRTAQREQEHLRWLRESLLQDARRLADRVAASRLAEAPPGDAPVPGAVDELLLGPAGDTVLLLAGDGSLLAGPQIPGLIEGLAVPAGQAVRPAFFVDVSDSLYLVALARISDGPAPAATVVVLRPLDNAWLQRRIGVAPDQLMFFSRGPQVLLGNYPGLDGYQVDSHQGLLYGAERQYRLHEVVLEGAQPEMPRLWLAVSETRMLAELQRYAQWLYLFAALGGLGVLLVGWLLLRNFERPYAQLMQTTQELLEGRLPVMARSAGGRTEMDRLVNRFADVLDTLRHEQKELKQVHEKLQHTAITDSLTRLYNRRYMQEVAPSLFAQVERDQRYLTAVLLDLDHFKDINDRHGHLGGDAVLVHFSRLLKHNSRANDHLFRIGGEEFLILNVTEDPQDSVALAEKLRELAMASVARYMGEQIPVTVSAGISCYYAATGNGSLSQLLRGADKALYEAKANGRNCVILHSSCRTAAAAAKKTSSVTLLKSDNSRA